MVVQEKLQGLTESYLLSLIAEALERDIDDSKLSVPFQELGIDSFRILQIIKKLEADFGTLPKTLLFENFNVLDLTRYFLEKHPRILEKKFAGNARPPIARPSVPAAMETPRPAPSATRPLLIREREAYASPELSATVKAIFDRYKNEGSVSRGTRNIAPHLFIGAERQGFFHFSRGGNIFLAYAYTGPDAHFPDLARQALQYCREHGLEFNLFSAEQVGEVGGTAFTATPFGAIQRIENLGAFTLQGNRMRRLRYQVSKFEGGGACRTEEHCCGSDPEKAKAIADLIDRWCAAKTMVNPLIHIVKAEILAGTLSPDHRIFLTYMGGVLQNAILITPLRPEDNGYLMDLEFYPPEMPLGGLEYAIANIVKILVAEGRSLLSLGGTYGVKLDSSPNADPGIEKILETLRERNLFNDEGNLQFKNKFRTENRSIYLCRPAAGSNPDNVTDIIMMIADPAKFQSPDPEPVATHPNPVPDPLPAPVSDSAPAGGEASPLRLPEAEGRGGLLSEAGFNPLNVPDAQVEFDLKTDSWPMLALASLDEHIAQLHRRLQEPADLEGSLKTVFPFRHFVLAGSGREAEHAFFKTAGRKGVVLQNLLFPSTLFNQIDNGFTPVELPCREILDPAATAAWQGGPDWDALRGRLEADPQSIAYVCLEVNDNAAGGSPMSFQRLKALKESLSAHAIPLILDGTRIVDYARQLIAEDPAMAGRPTWDVVREICLQADVLLASLTKDFCVKAGGLIALNDAAQFHELQDLVQEEGIGLDVIDKKLVALSLQQKDAIEALVSQRMDAVRFLAGELARQGAPVARPALGHCILIHVTGIPEFRSFRCPVASFLAWMYLGTGIRGSAHNAGMLKGTYLNDSVRLAIPVGMTKESVREIATRFAALFATKADIPDLVTEGGKPLVPGDVHARYRVTAVHGASSRPAAAAAPGAAEALNGREPVPAYVAYQPVEPVAAGAGVKGTAPMAIAIVGMAGRYPKSRNMAELWENLSQGRDCIETLPEERFQQRLRHGFAKKYRGGFIDGVDRFDSLFFSISPREAEGIDPQERLFLEAAWEAIEDAGYYPETLVQEKAPRDVGVFVGAVWAMYQMFGAEEKLAGNDVNPNSFLWSIANRVSYFLNLTGPSLTLDTACSSSLTALHLACEAIRKGECSSAIVGGVNLDLHQSKWDINKAGGALSEDGICRTFGKGANGYVAGEGIGAVFLKPLDQALRDGDNVQAVIRSVVVNHGGKTSGYTVPNPHAQARLIQAALQQAGLDARTIGYIEAHGTGTELGDPIEISGLTNAFQAYHVEKQGCSVGSVKTNIGHLEAAAGLVGLQKVALQMTHGQLVPSLHSAELNGFIDFAGSPFYVQQKAEPWLAKEVDGIKHPLRAGVSSFGAGGANAHVILERYEGALRPRGDSGAERVFPLSARSEEQLRDAAIRLRDHLLRDLARVEGSRQDLDDISFTLRVGRKSFDHRLAVVAVSKEELLERLGTFLGGGKDASVLAGHVKNAAGITKMLNRQEKEAFIQLLSRDRDPRKLAQLWTDGLLADWQGSQPEGTGRRVSLPTYPFAGKRHWVERKPQAAPAPGNGPAALHPMIDANESTFERQVFRKTFHDRQFFIFDHLVSGIPTLPGVAYLDFARKAGELAAGRRVKSIRNILWISPITVAGGKPTRAFIELKPQGDTVQFEVFGEGQDGRRQPFSQGRITYAPLDGEAPTESIDLAAVQARCRKVIDGKDAYPKFKAFGLDLGPSFQVLQEVSKSDEEVLGKLRIPEHILGEFQDFLLHPSLVDGSLQAGMAAQLGGAAKEMFVPYSIGEVEILHPLQPLCYSYVRSANAPGSKVSKANVLIVDETGKVLVKILDSVGVPLVSVHEKPAASVNAADAAEFPKLFYVPDWIDAPPAAAAPNPDPILFFDCEGGLGTLYRERLAAAGGDPRRAARVRPGSAYGESGDLDYAIDPGAPEDYQRLCESLAKAGFALGKICFAWPLSPDQDGQARAEEATEAGEALRQALDHSVFALFHLVQALARHFPGGKLQILYAFKGGDGAFLPHHEAINGFARTLHIEHPKINAKVLEIREPVPGSARLLDLLLAELECDTQDVTTVRLAEGGRKVRTLKKFDPAQDAAQGAASPRATGFKDKGVYLITGGAGGLGLLFAEHLAERHAARLVLTGRSPLSAEKESRLEAMRKLGAEVAYVVADVSRREDADRLVQETKARYGSLQGIIHSAGVLRDSYLKNKTREEMEAVFAPKLFGTLNLDWATRSEGLDFFVAFSSLAALGGNAGQADYAYANHFMDGFSWWREGLREKGERSGKTLSINWSLWADGGMKLDEQTELFFRRNLGIKPLGREAGIEALAMGLSLGLPQFAVLEGVQEKIELAWGLRKKEPAAPPAAAQPVAASASAPAGAASDQGELAALVQGELIRIAMEMLKLDAEDVAPDKILLDLGFDSIGMTTYANAINELYKLDITPVLFFEFPSIQDIARHLCAERKDEIAAYHRRGAAPAKTAANASAPVASASTHAPARSGEEIRFNKGWSPAPAAPAASPSGAEDFPKRRFVDMPIAVVGMSGVMPQSDDLEEFWENLREARNLVTEIPRDRWKWEDFEGDPLKERNKTNSKWGGFMREVDKFDPLFFGISPREAEMMDPQQRIFLETVWKAIEDSGHKVSDLAGTKTGLFVGAATRDYADVLASHQCTLDGYTASGNSHSVLVNRVSFLLNLRGPSAPLDTACSSSLVALHRAIESIHSGSCDMAIVGGVQLMLTPSAYISFSAAGMLSPDGKCKSFDKAANGYVRGEGSGAILLKPLAMAEADGDRILAVIKATAENHGGRVTALTAPNPNAQTELLVEAYGKGRVDPATVGFIECHGTGTSLGDPIEIQALSKAFATLYKDHGRPVPAAAHCGLSSVKTNIGHLETAAGIAGVLKVLLALRHKQIPANLHFRELNPYINLKGTPFFIADKTTDWECAKDEAGNPLPRRAGVSSFGFGGANAHVVFEEYPAARPSASGTGPQLIVISAKNEDRLRAYVASHVAHLGKHAVGLADMAYTLQVGRDEMPERLAMVADSVEDLHRKLSAWLEGKPDAGPVYRGNARKPKEKPPGAAAAKAMAERKDLAKLAEAWIAGEAIDWRLLHQGDARQRIALPTYPFARERHWFAIPELPAAEATVVPGRVPALHPLVHRNISTLSEQKFLTELTGEEFFLDEHRVESRKILPGVAYLEMARAAGEIAGEAPVRVLRNIVWLRPLFSEGGVEKAEISLVPDRDGVEFAIRSHGKPVSVTYCTGKLGYEEASGDPDALDLDGIRKRCHEEVIEGKGLYEYLHGLGLHLGKGFQIVQGISATPTEALARLRLPDHLQAGADRFWLHPALLDGSLHTSIGLTLKNGTALAAGLPFTAREIQILEPLTRLRYAYATFAEGEERAEPGARKLNITLLDEQGRVLVRVKEFFMKPFSMEASRKLSGGAEAAGKLPGGLGAPAPKSELQALVPVWKPLPSASAGESAEPTRPLLLGGSPEQLAWLRKSYPQAARLALPADADTESLAAALSAALEGAGFDHLLWMAPDLAEAEEPASLIQDQERGVLEVFRLIKALLHLKYGQRELRWTLITGRTAAVRPGETLHPAHAGMAGLAGSLAKEYPRWQLGWLDVDSLESITARACLTAARNGGEGLAWRGGEWHRQELAPRELTAAKAALAPAYKHRGVYVVIGGAGGLGEVWSRFMIERFQARLVWIGRRAADADIEGRIAALGRLGTAPLYVQADAADLASLQAAAEAIKLRYPAVHGVVHSALVLQDQSLMNMDLPRFASSLSAKVDVSVNMDKVFGGADLDFMLFFSSMISFFKTPGQSNYAAGCTFKDSFARHLAAQRPYPVQVMNWGYWGHVGVAGDEASRKRLEQVGIGSIEPGEAMEALQSLVGSDIPQLYLIKTVEARAASPAPAPAPEPRKADGAPAQRRKEAAAPADVTEAGKDAVQRVLVEKLSASLKIDGAKIPFDGPFVDFGVDSIIGVNLVNSINEALGIDLEVMVLFDYSTINQLTGHILSRFKEKIEALLAVPVAPVRKAAPAAEAPSRPREMPKSRFLSRAAAEGAADAVRPEFEPIAIIGMSGRFADSANLEEFWSHLRAGKDLVSEVTRWRKQDCVMSRFVDGKYCSRGSFIDGIDKFDAAFFQISSLEANYMDPQQRLFLEEAWRALEDAGYAGSVDGKNCGVYVGCGSSGYESLFAEEPPAQAFWGNSDAILPARIAYHLNLQGPAVAIDTACSASLVGMHIACQGLWARETEMALAGGVFLASNSGFYKVANRAGMLSPEGKCQAFDDKADGFVPGEGVGVVVLKRLSDALRDHDGIYGVIAGSGINQDGKTNGIIAPSAASQERLERAVYDRFGIDPATIQVIEAHGTGTRLGDPIEFGALTRAFRKYTDRKQFCAIGSVKTNIGHAATAAGVAGVLKLLLALKHREIPPSLHFEQGNAAIDFQSSPFFVNARLRAWESTGKRRAAISSFGFSGTNAHLVLEEAPAPAPNGFHAPGYLVVLSAAGPGQLRRQVENLLAHCRRAPDLSLNDLCHTLFVGRAHLNHRFTCVARDPADLVRTLEAWVAHGSAAQANAYAINRGTLREQGALKAFGNQCLRACAEGAESAGDEGGARYLEHLTALADLYGQGYSLDYTALFPQGSRRISLPTYPFAGESHWAEMAQPGAAAAKPGRAAVSAPMAAEIHPLLHENISVLNQQRYRSVFSGAEPFLASRGQDGRRLFPEAACLEMARAAVEDASPWLAGAPFELRDVSWGPPAECREGRAFEVTLSETEEGRIDFGIASWEDDRETLHCRGLAGPTAAGENAAAPVQDIAKLKSLLGGDRPRQPGASQILVPFEGPEIAEDGTSAWVIVPGVLESAFRAAARLLPGPTAGSAAPESLESLRIFAPLTGGGHAWVRSARRVQSRHGAAKFDVDLLDPQGRVVAQVRSLAFAGSAAAGNDSLVEFNALLASLAGPEPADSPQGGHDGSATEVFANLLDEIRWKEDP
ncbi:MAG TPA: SDR family NAD(P)-dependent oxidoreductase [Fibrobacteria bacterium]|nr:SDR family NAD(P)-dependent oxidoreductase [Fibrobacteria bacterium]